MKNGFDRLFFFGYRLQDLMADSPEAVETDAVHHRLLGPGRGAVTVRDVGYRYDCYDCSSGSFYFTYKNSVETSSITRWSPSLRAGLTKGVCWSETFRFDGISSLHRLRNAGTVGRARPPKAAALAGAVPQMRPAHHRLPQLGPCRPPPLVPQVRLSATVSIGNSTETSIPTEMLVCEFLVDWATSMLVIETTGGTGLLPLIFFKRETVACSRSSLRHQNSDLNLLSSHLHSRLDFDPHDDATVVIRFLHTRIIQ